MSAERRRLRQEYETRLVPALRELSSARRIAKSQAEAEQVVRLEALIIGSSTEPLFQQCIVVESAEERAPQLKRALDEVKALARTIEDSMALRLSFVELDGWTENASGVRGGVVGYLRRKLELPLAEAEREASQREACELAIDKAEPVAREALELVSRLKKAAAAA